MLENIVEHLHRTLYFVVGVCGVITEIHLTCNVDKISENVT